MVNMKYIGDCSLPQKPRSEKIRATTDAFSINIKKQNWQTYFVLKTNKISLNMIVISLILLLDDFVLLLTFSKIIRKDIGKERLTKNMRIQQFFEGLAVVSYSLR